MEKGSSMGNRAMKLIAVLAGVLLLLAACSPEELEVRDRMNQIRADRNLAPLTLHPGASDLARDWSELMLAGKCPSWSTKISGRSDLCHNPRAGDWLAAGCRCDYHGGGYEIVGRSSRSIAHVIELFMASPPHRAGIISPHYTHAAIGVAGDAERGYAVTVWFFRPV